MKEERFFYVPEAPVTQQLPVEEARHAVKVLRLVPGSMVYIMDGKGSFYEAELTVVDNHHCFFEIKKTLPQQRTWQGRIHLAIAPTKMMERMEWMSEKITEIGIDELSFLNCSFSERHVLRTDRVERIVTAAVKQSRKAWMPKVNGICEFADFINQPRSGHKFIAHCYDEIPRADLFDSLSKLPADDDTTILVGPEGDFSVNEVQMAIQQGYQPVSLGSSRLRTETAGMVAVTMAQLLKRK